MSYVNQTTEEIEQTHRRMVANLFKSGEQLLTEMTPEKLELAHAALLLTSEAGELGDAIKAHVFYNKPLDFENALEELGDIEFALSAIRARLGFTRKETQAHNLNKLNKRYSNGYSNEAAQQRADKIETPND